MNLKSEDVDNFYQELIENHDLYYDNKITLIRIPLNKTFFPRQRFHTKKVKNYTLLENNTGMGKTEYAEIQFGNELDIADPLYDPIIFGIMERDSSQTTVTIWWNDKYWKPLNKEGITILNLFKKGRL